MFNSNITLKNILHKIAAKNQFAPPFTKINQPKDTLATKPPKPVLPETPKVPKQPKPNFVKKFALVDMFVGKDRDKNKPQIIDDIQKPSIVPKNPVTSKKGK